MARRRRRGGRSRRGRGGFSFSPLSIALIAALALVAWNFISVRDPMVSKVNSEHDIFVLDSTSHDQAELLTRTKIFKRMANPFGSYFVEGKEISENGSGLAAEITVIVVSSQTNLSMRKDIVTHKEIDKVWEKLIGNANYSRSLDIYSSFISPSSPMWEEVVRQYFVNSDGLEATTACESNLRKEATKMTSTGGKFSRALGYLNRTAEGGIDGAWSTLCQFAYDMKSNFQAVGGVLDLASAACHAGKGFGKDNRKKCSDIPGATEQIQSILQERDEWLSSKEKGIKKHALVCAYFGSDMITNSQDNNTEFLDLKFLLDTGKFKEVEGGASALGSNASATVLGNNFSSKVIVKVYAPNIADTKNLDNPNGTAEKVNFLKEYWGSYFADGFDAAMSDASFGCEGKEFDYQGGN